MDQVKTLEHKKGLKNLGFRLLIHQIVAVVFLKPCLGIEVHHMNGKTWDNRRQNLNGDYRLGTPVEVIEQGSNKKPLSFLTITDAFKEQNIACHFANVVLNSWFEHKGKNFFFKQIVSTCFKSLY